MAENPETSEAKQVPEDIVPETCEIVWDHDANGKLVFKGLSCADADTEVAYQAMDRATEYMVMKKPIKVD